MSKTRIVPRRHRTLWISDVHLGSEGCKARALTQFLKYNECEQLYLVGDIFDGWKLKSKFYWHADHSRVIHAVISKARRGTKVHYIAGNHDDFLRQFVRKQLRLGQIRLVNEAVHVTADGRRLLVVHGDVFDEVVSGAPWLAHAADLFYSALMRADASVQRLRGDEGPPKLAFAGAVKTQVKSAVQWLSGVDEKKLYRCRREGLQGVVTGHTHHAEVRHLKNGIVSYNCGDWVESCTALTEDANGEIRLIRWDPALSMPPRRVASTATPRRRAAPTPLKDVVAGVSQRLRERAQATAATPRIRARAGHGLLR